MVMTMIPGKPFKPMEPVTHDAPFNDESFLHQVKYDGVRILAHSADGKITLWNRKSRCRTPQYPEIADELRRSFPDRDFVLDGEVIAIVNGKPDFHAVLRRDWATDRNTISRLTKVIPIAYVVFDILYLDESPLITRSLEERIEILSQYIPAAGVVTRAESYPDGVDLFEAVKQLGLEGIVSKRRNSRYEPGRRSRNWLKIKHRMETRCVIGGYILTRNSINSVFLGIQELEGSLTFVGRCPVYPEKTESDRLIEVLGKPREACPFEPIAELKPLGTSGSSRPVWVEPLVWCRVEFLEWTDKGLLRNPRLLEIEG